jgi:hypothetical protein
MKERAEAPKILPGWIWGGLIGCGIIMSWMAWNDRAAHQRLQEAFGGENNLRCVQEASKVYATRLGASPDAEHPREIDDFVAIAEPFEVSGDLSRRLQKLLTSPSSYRRDVTVSCIPQYGYRLRFVCDKSAIEAWVCLECGLTSFVVDGKIVGGGLFLPVEHKVKELSKELFPGDRGMEEAADRSRN